jgi:hypothetical protein
MSRLVLAAVAAAVIAFLASGLTEHNACEDARQAFFSAASAQPADEARLAPALADVRTDCEGAEPLVAAAGALANLGGRDEKALALAREATEREPEAFNAWRARAAMAAGAERAEATRRGRALNPRWTGPPRERLAAPAPGAGGAAAAGP